MTDIILPPTASRRTRDAANPKNTMITFRVTPALREALARAATEAGVGRSDIIRGLLVAGLSPQVVKDSVI